MAKSNKGLSVLRDCIEPLREKLKELSAETLGSLDPYPLQKFIHYGPETDFSIGLAVEWLALNISADYAGWFEERVNKYVKAVSGTQNCVEALMLTVEFKEFLKNTAIVLREKLEGRPIEREVSAEEDQFGEQVRNLLDSLPPPPRKPPSDLVNRHGIAELAHRSPETVKDWEKKKDWPDPIIPASGNAPPQYGYKAVRRLLQKQLDKELPKRLPENLPTRPKESKK